METRIRGGWVYRASKRLFDVSLAAVALTLASPLIAAIAVWIRLDSSGSAFYRSERVGRGQVPFRVFKFRTMVAGADKIGASSTPKHDPRITRAGAVLRRFNLDELPQLINIVMGKMSFVGPRPQVTWALSHYSEEELAIFDVPPGMAPYAFVVLPREGEVLDGSTDPDGDYFRKIHPYKTRLSLEYVRNRSASLDAMIFIDTFCLSFFGKALFLGKLRESYHEIVQNAG